VTAAGAKPAGRRRRNTAPLLRLVLGALGAAAGLVLALHVVGAAFVPIGRHWLQRSSSGFVTCARRPGGASSVAGHSASAVRLRAVPEPEVLPPVGSVDEDEYLDVWDQSTMDLALDVRELLITDANVYIIGPDVESYEADIREMARLLNYTYVQFNYSEIMNATEAIGDLEKIVVVPPLVSVQRWSWAIMRHGLVVWIDPDGYRRLDVYERDRISKLKFPKKKAAFGPEKQLDVRKQNLGAPPADPIDMWQEADAHVDLQAHPDLPPVNTLMGSIIEAMLNSPPKWRGWTKQAKIRGTIAPDFENPFEIRRNFHSNGISPRLNRLLKA